MKKEYSFGAVIYRYNNGKREFIVEEMNLGHISLPKGHIEEGETPIETARREIKEELGLDANINDAFRKTITYSPAFGVIKDVTFFLATVEEKEITVQKEEVSKAYFLEYEEAYNRITHTSDKKVLQSANRYLDKMGM